MKRILSFLLFFFLLLNFAYAESINLDGLSFDELSALRDRILIEMMKRDEWQEVTVPVGTYQVGKHIPAGHWVITCAPRNYCYVTVGGKLHDNKKHIVYGSSGYYHVSMAGTDSGISDRGYPSSVDIELTDGMYVFIEHANVTFTPYTGLSTLSFK